MKIALITDGIYPYVIGGMQKHSYYLARYLAENNIDVDLYHFRRNNSDLSKEVVFGKVSHKINFIELEFPNKGILPFHYLLESKEYSRRIFIEFMKKAKPDLIICKGFTAWEFTNQKNKENLPPVCVNFHGYEMFQKSFGLKSWFIKQILKIPVGIISRKADFVFSYGPGITKILTTKVGVKLSQVIEIPGGVEEKWLSKEVSKTGAVKKFVFLGRYELRKGIIELTNALAEIINVEGWTFDFIGEIPEKLRIRSERIKYHGTITDFLKINELLKEADVLVCPSWSEGMPNVILEAMASGLAVVATDTGATSLLVNDKTGWLLSEPEPLEIASCLKKIINTDPEEIDEKKKQALGLVSSEFTWEKISEKLLLSLRSIIKSNAESK